MNLPERRIKAELLKKLPSSLCPRTLILRESTRTRQPRSPPTQPAHRRTDRSAPTRSQSRPILRQNRTSRRSRLDLSPPPLICSTTMVATPNAPQLTPAEYLTWEPQQPQNYEYIDRPSLRHGRRQREPQPHRRAPSRPARHPPHQYRLHHEYPAQLSN